MVYCAHTMQLHCACLGSVCRLNNPPSYSAAAADVTFKQLLHQLCQSNTAINACTFLDGSSILVAPTHMHLCNVHTYPDVCNSVVLTVEWFDALHVHTLMCPMMTVPSTQVCRRLLCRSLTPIGSCCVCPSCSTCCGRLCCAFCKPHQSALSLKGSIHCTMKCYPLWCWQHVAGLPGLLEHILVGTVSCVGCLT